MHTVTNELINSSVSIIFQSFWGKNIPNLKKKKKKHVPNRVNTIKKHDYTIKKQDWERLRLQVHRFLSIFSRRVIKTCFL